MKNYRIAFIIVLVANLVLVGVLAGFWWRSHHPATQKSAVTPASNPAPQQEMNNPPEPPPSAETPLSPIQLSPERLQSIGVKFGVVQRKDLKDTIRTTGTVAIDERRVSYVQTRISGHIEKVFADATYQYVRKGQPLFTIHSPELVAAERGIVLGKKSGLDSIRIKTEELGLDVPEERRAELLARVKELGARKRGLVTDDELRRLASG